MTPLVQELGVPRNQGLAWDVTRFPKALQWELGLHKPGPAHPGWSRSQQRG